MADLEFFLVSKNDIINLESSDCVERSIFAGEFNTNECMQKEMNSQHQKQRRDTQMDIQSRII